ncbi:hypothetical protein HDU84_002921 [Entophlyctis sp. JEL0112]|nr:hypothetical protein HDU84_002921 [Entophlyctis sp. JEL0112]
MTYSITRGISVVVEMYPLLAYPLQMMFYISPAIIFLSPTLNILHAYFIETSFEPLLNSLNHYSAFLTAVVMISAELTVLASFVKYLRRCAYRLSAVDAKFVIVANYGTACVVMGFLAVAMYCLLITVGDDIYFVGMLFSFTIIGTLMIGMKIALHYQALFSAARGSILQKASKISSTAY